MSLVNNRGETEVYLEHYGKKGMRWGVRKARKTGRRVKKGAKSYATAAKKQHQADIKKAQERDAKIIKAVKKKVKALKAPENREKVVIGAMLAGAVVAAIGTAAVNSSSNRMAERAFTQGVNLPGILGNMPPGVSSYRP